LTLSWFLSLFPLSPQSLNHFPSQSFQWMVFLRALSRSLQLIVHPLSTLSTPTLWVSFTAVPSLSRMLEETQPGTQWRRSVVFPSSLFIFFPRSLRRLSS
jgi:hypothetical protein